jgi:hypothetical protein
LWLDAADNKSFVQESHWPLAADATGPQPQWENDERTETVPGTITIEEVVVPNDTPEPQRIAWADIPNQQRHPYTDVGPAPDVDPTDDPWPQVDPPLVIGPGTDTPGPVIDPVPDLDTGTDLAPQTGTQPGSTTGTVPGTTVSVVPSVVPQTSPKSSVDTPVRNPAADKTRERKTRLSNAALTALRVANKLGNTLDILDVVNALWNQVLPPQCKTGYAQSRDGNWYRAYRSNQTQRMADVVRCWDHMPLEDALRVIIANQLQDKLYGFIGQAQKKGAQHLAHQGLYDRPVGFQSGPADQGPGYDNMGQNPFDPTSAFADDLASGLDWVFGKLLR